MSYMTKELFSIKDLAVCCRVATLTARRWILTGKLKALPRATDRTKYLVTRAALEEFCQGRMPLPSDKTITEAAYEMNMKPDLVHYYIETGALYAVQLGMTGDYRIPQSAIKLFLHKKKRIDLFKVRTIKEILGNDYNQI